MYIILVIIFLFLIRKILFKNTSEKQITKNKVNNDKVKNIEINESNNKNLINEIFAYKRIYKNIIIYNNIMI